MNPFQRGASFVLKLLVIISAVIGIVLSYLGGRNSFMGGAALFMYFTIQSNIAIALIELVGLILMSIKKNYTNMWHIIKYIGTVSITLTGVVFCFVLAPTLGAGAFSLSNVLTHVVVPVAAVIDFFVTGIDSQIKFRTVLFVIIPPIVYAIYAGVGYVQKWEFSPGVNYPYFFLNWGGPLGAFGLSKEFPFMGCAWWILCLLVFLLIVGCLYLLLVKLFKLMFRRKISV